MPDIRHRTVTDSTMDDARQAVGAGASSWTVCLADRQKKGRGRIPGRHWEDDGKSLLFTLVLHRNLVHTGYPLTQLMALALCRHLEDRHGLSPEIKWPNDVLVGGKKIAGILVEGEGNYFLAGLGLNLTQSVFPGDLRRPAASLQSVLGSEAAGPESEISRDDELSGLLEVLERSLKDPEPIDAVSRRLRGVGQRTRVLLGDPARNEVLSGVVAGLQDDGALLVHEDSGKLVPVYSGEIDEEKS